MADVLLENEAIKVLETVKPLGFISNTRLMSSQMIAEWFEVSRKTINKLNGRNREKLEDIGVKKLSYKEVEKLVDNSNLFNRLKIARQGVTVFNPISILYTATLLAGSLVAERVRRNMSNSKNSFVTRMLVNNNENCFFKQRQVHRVLQETFSGILSISSEVCLEGYFVDFVISNENKKLAIEVDEYGHANYCKIKERIREKILLKEYDALIRYNPDDENESIFQLINKIIKEMEKP